MYEALEAGGIILAQAPTGMGKTDAALAAALTYGLRGDATVLFLTPKTSQHRIAVQAASGISRKYSLDFRGVDLVGKRHMCTDATTSRAKGEEFYLSCQRKRKDAACPHYGNTRGYSKMQEARSTHAFETLAAALPAGVLSHAEIVSLAREKGMCGHELGMRIGSVSRLIIADYSQLFVPSMRDLFLRKLGKKIEELVIIVDEAHNVAPRVRDYLSSSINSFVLSRAAKEAAKLQSPLPLREFAAKFDSWADGELEGGTEKPVEREAFLSLLPGEPAALSIACEDLGIEFLQQTEKQSSALLDLSAFLSLWGEEDDSSVRLLRNTKRVGYSLSKKCLDPAPFTRILNNARAAILMSGTLLPLAMHRDVLALDPARSVMKEYSSPFSPLNRINIIAKGFTTKFSRRDEAEYTRMGAEISKIIAAVPGNTALFFPSFGVQASVMPFVSAPGCELFVQTDDMAPRDVTELFKKFVESERGVIVGAQGGSLAEGVDYPDGMLKCAVVVGIPLQEMGAEVEALISYYDARMGKGWEYGYLYPAVMKSLQAAGRCIRSETDRAAIVFLDERFAWNNYRRCFPKDFDAVVSPSPAELVKRFFS